MKKNKLILATTIALGLAACFYSFNYSQNIPTLKIPMQGQETPNILFDDNYSNKELPKEAKTLEANVYKFVVSNNSEKEVKALSKKYGFTDDDQIVNNGDSYDIRNGEKVFSYFKDTGEWLYQESTLLDNKPKVIPSNEEAISIAKKYLNEKSVDITRFTNIIVTDNSSGDVTTNDKKIISKEVYFYPSIENKPVYGVSRIIVSVGDKGKVVGINKYCKDLNYDKKTKISTHKKAFEKLNKKEASINIDPRAKSAKVNNVELAYWEDAGTINEQPYLQPVWVFSGEATLDNGEIKTFDAVVPAIE